MEWNNNSRNLRSMWSSYRASLGVSFWKVVTSWSRGFAREMTGVKTPRVRRVKERQGNTGVNDLRVMITDLSKWSWNILSEPYPEGSGPETGVGANSEKPQEEHGNSGVLYTRENVLRQCPGNETPEGSTERWQRSYWLYQNIGQSESPKVRLKVRSQEFLEFLEFYRKGSSTNEGKLSEKEGIY
ncbi:hypothetical protein EDC04DRAFT_2615953 [Pisolithus marmoratus]|nr:hypothetical protein EDC04DRAFT_2615953 [Pisolithus marmoratus]